MDPSRIHFLLATVHANSLKKYIYAIQFLKNDVAFWDKICYTIGILSEQERNMVHSFLLIGQSNAAGRGLLGEARPLETNEKKLKVLRNGRWQTMYRPVNPDRPMSGTCLAESFAKAYSDAHPDVEVGIIPCADGGTSLSQWQPGELLLDHALHCAKLAMRTSHLVGVLWHQGESDCSEDCYRQYADRFQIIMDTIKQELGRPDLPFLLGGLGDFLIACAHSEDLKNYGHVNAALQQIVQTNENTAFVSAEGLGCNSDHLHFSAEALWEFGFRYFDAFQSLDIDDRILVQEPSKSDTERTAMELL